MGGPNHSGIGEGFPARAGGEIKERQTEMNKIELEDTWGGAVLKNSIATILSRKSKEGILLEIATGLSAADGHPDLLWRVDGRACQKFGDAKKPEWDDQWGVLDEDSPQIPLQYIGEGADMYLDAREAIALGEALVESVADKIAERAERDALSEDWQELVEWIRSVVEESREAADGSVAKMEVRFSEAEE